MNPSKALAIIGSIIVGALTVVQSRINGTFGEKIGDGIFTAWIAFSIGLVVIILIVAVFPSQRAAFSRLKRELRPGSEARSLHWHAVGAIRPWHVLGGIGGATFVVAQSTTVQYLGVAMFTIGVVSAQNVGSLFCDRIGLGPRGVQRVTWQRVMAAALAIVGVTVAVSSQEGAGAFNLAGIALVVLAGLLVSAQQSVNGRVAQTAGSPMIAGLSNFVSGWIYLVIAFGVTTLFRQHQINPPPSPLEEPWLWTGGLIGLLFIIVAAWTVRQVGVLVFALLSITGQLVGALLIDILIPDDDVNLGPGLFFGVAITGCAVLLATAFSNSSKNSNSNSNRNVGVDSNNHASAGTDGSTRNSQVERY